MRFHQDMVRRLAGAALEGGGALVRMGLVRWNVAGDCEAPVFREFVSHPYATNRNVRTVSFPFDGGPLTVEIEMRCRACLPCARSRAAEWRLRASHECRVSPRTWFGTFTLSPQSHWTMALRASARLALGGTNFHALPEPEQWAERHKENGREFTLYFKRLRKNTGVKLRYLLVAESHKSGLPHYHALIHEVSALGSVKKAELEGTWPWGYTQFRLVETTRIAGYVTKYIAKSIDARIRASINYGTGGEGETLPWIKAGCPPLEMPIRKETF